MASVIYIDRTSGQRQGEKVYGGRALEFLYGDDFFSRIFGAALLHTLVRRSPFSALYGSWQKLPCSKRKIRPFIDAFHVDSSEFLEPLESFSSFNDFFIRKLKPEARPIAPGKECAIIPADGRYFFYQNINRADGFIVKGKKFDLSALLQDEQRAKKYESGSMMIARLCPTDYHRFHFPCDTVPSQSRLVNGWLYSVNPVAVRKNVKIFTENKRMVTELQTDVFGRVAFVEVGATNVGSINQTYHPGVFYSKGAEKGFFAFGGSALIVLFEPGAITFDPDLLDVTAQGIEVRCLMGQSMGRAGL